MQSTAHERPARTCDEGDAVKTCAGVTRGTRLTGVAMSDDDYFLFTCEKVWTLFEDGRALLTRAIEAKNAGDEGAVEAVAHRIDLNQVKRRLLLARVYDMARPSAG